MQNSYKPILFQYHNNSNRSNELKSNFVQLISAIPNNFNCFEEIILKMTKYN